jgi:hypothetical protein
MQFSPGSFTLIIDEIVDFVHMAIVMIMTSYGKKLKISPFYERIRRKVMSVSKSRELIHARE